MFVPLCWYSIVMFCCAKILYKSTIEKIFKKNLINHLLRTICIPFSHSSLTLNRIKVFFLSQVRSSHTLSRSLSRGSLKMYCKFIYHSTQTNKQKNSLATFLWIRLSSCSFAHVFCSTKSLLSFRSFLSQASIPHHTHTHLYYNV